MWVAGVGTWGVARGQACAPSHRTPSPPFAAPEASKEPHNSIERVPVVTHEPFPARQAHSLPGPAGPNYQAGRRS